MENEIASLQEKWKQHLESLTAQIQSDIRGIVTGQMLQYIQYKPVSFADIIYFYFEYEHDSYDIIARGINKAGDEITEPIILPTKNDDPEWKHLISKDIWDKEMKWYERLDNEYYMEKGTIFEEWFEDCWDTAVKDIEVTPGAYFSIHDTNVLTDLKTGEEVEWDEIEERYK